MKVYASNFLILENKTCPKDVVRYDVFDYGKIDGFIFGCFEDIADAKLQGNENFSCWNLSVSYFMPFLKNEYLNFKDSYFKQVCQLNDSDIGMFIRSDSGKKVWSGQILKDIGLLNFIKSTIQDDEMMFLAKPRECKNEVRFWIKDEKIISYSPYSGTDRNGFINENIYIEKYEKYVKEIIKEWEPDSKYVIDVCESNNEFKVVEYNCFSSSGFYSADIGKIVDSVR